MDNTSQILRQMRDDIASLKLRSVDNAQQPIPTPSYFAKTDGIITPYDKDNERVGKGDVIIMRRWGDPEKAQETSMKVPVFNYGGRIEGDVFCQVYLDHAGDYWVDEPQTETTGFFLTPGDGMRAGFSKFHPAATGCFRYRFENSFLVQEQGQGTTPVYNHTLNSVSGDTVIQAKKIDGHWFIDVEPC